MKQCTNHTVLWNVLKLNETLKAVSLVYPFHKIHFLSFVDYWQLVNFMTVNRNVCDTCDRWNQFAQTRHTVKLSTLFWNAWLEMHVCKRSYSVYPLLVSFRFKILVKLIQEEGLFYGTNCNNVFDYNIQFIWSHMVSWTQAATSNHFHSTQHKSTYYWLIRILAVYKRT